MYCEPRYGGAPSRPPMAGTLGALSWEQFTAVQGGERTYTDTGVIIQPKATDPVVISDPVREQPTYSFEPAPKPEPVAQEPAPEPEEQTYFQAAGPDWIPQPSVLPAPGGAAPVTVSGTAPEGDRLAPEEKGFGMFEAGLGAGLALRLAKAWSRRR